MNKQTALAKAIIILFLVICVSILVIYIFLTVEFQLWEQFNWPSWVFLWINALGLILLFEIPGFFSPNHFRTPMSLFLKESLRDKLTVLGVVLFVLTAFSVAMSLPIKVWRLSDMQLWFYIPPWLGWWMLVCFGSEKMRTVILPQQIREAHKRDQVVLILAGHVYLISYIVLFNMMVSIGFWIIILFGIIPYFLSWLIRFVFGSQTLRDNATPKWLKNRISKSEPKGE
jgi:hypothetical protein